MSLSEQIGPALGRCGEGGSEHSVTPTGLRGTLASANIVVAGAMLRPVFDRSAGFYDALYEGKDYAAAVAYLQAVLDRAAPSASRLLDVGCGTGRHLELLRERYDVEGVDINPGLLEVARARNPDVPLHEADMAEFSLDARFDVVTCLFSSIGYVRTEARMRSAVSAMRSHLRPSGVIVMEPWFTPESYRTGTITANLVDQPGMKIAWMYTSERDGDVSLLDIHYLVGRPAGVELLREHHEIALFTPEQHLSAFRDAGLEASYEDGGPFGRGLYVACDRASAAAVEPWPRASTS